MFLQRLEALFRLLTMFVDALEEAGMLLFRAFIQCGIVVQIVVGVRHTFASGLCYRMRV